MTLPPPHSPIHILGIGGVGMSALAFLLLEQGFRVSGSDLRPSPITHTLLSRGVPVLFGPSPDAAAAASLWIHPPNIPPNHPELLAASSARVPSLPRDAALSLLLSHYPTTYISGFPRRALTAALIAASLPHAGLFAGILRRDSLPHAFLGQHMLAEFDEFQPTPSPPLPHSLIITAPPTPPISSPITISPTQPLPSPSQTPSFAFLHTPSNTSLYGDVEHEDPHKTLLKLHTHNARGDVEQFEHVFLPPGSDMAAAATAAATFLHLHAALPLSEITPQLAAAAQNLIGHFEVISAHPLRVHDVRTYPQTIAQSINDIRRLSPSVPAVLFRPYPPTFDAFPLSVWVNLFASHPCAPMILPDYHDPTAPRAAALLAALPKLAYPLRDAASIIAFGGDDMRLLLGSDTPF